ncbi:MAG: hypothetical protein IAF58_22490 [Leptolyngbya sp.]|nr:hypothetical protein [Candidatus Melainabacteria bacterium]
MTQWLFQADICVCPIESKAGIEPFSETPTPMLIPPPPKNSSAFSSLASPPRRLILGLFSLLIAMTLAGMTYLHFSSAGTGGSVTNGIRMQPQIPTALASCSSELYASAITLDQSGFEMFEKRAFDTLSLGGESLTSEQFAGISKLRGLKNLTLNGVKQISLNNFQQISGAENLQFLEVDEMTLDSDVCKLLSRMKLQKLELNRCTVESSDLTPIIRSKIPEVVLMMPLRESTIEDLKQHRQRQNNALFSLKTSN